MSDPRSMREGVYTALVTSGILERLLDNAVQRGGLAVVGMPQTIDALEAGQADLFLSGRDAGRSLF